MTEEILPEETEETGDTGELVEAEDLIDLPDDVEVGDPTKGEEEA